MSASETELGSCPFCSLNLPFAELERHANSHFQNEEDDQIAYDRKLAQQIASSSTTNLDAESGFGKGFSPHTFDILDVNQKVSYLIDSQRKSSFHRIKDGGLVCLLKKCLENESKSKPRDCTISLLCGYVDHFECMPSEDDGWGCGWRNIQILCSYLLSNRDESKPVLFGGSEIVPDIPSLQRWLEIAWERGFDPPGALHFDHKVYGSTKWIGTTECAALLRSFGVRARIVDFGPKDSRSLFLSVPGSAIGEKKRPFGPMDTYLVRKKRNDNQGVIKSDPSGSSSKQICGKQTLLDWVWNYFSDRSLAIAGASSSRAFVTNKAPLYFQHDGHSRTIVGIQKHQRGFENRYTLLVLDPGHRTPALEKSLKENAGWQQFFKRGAHTLSKRQYQLCYPDSGIAVGDDVQKMKTINSTFIEV